MKFKGPLGIPRFRNFGPLVDKRPLFNQAIEGAENFDAAVNDILEEEGIELEVDDDGTLRELSEEQMDMIADELAQRTFPDSERRQDRFKRCLESTWANQWSRGFTESGNQDDLSDLERLSFEASGCAGFVESVTLGP